MQHQYWVTKKTVLKKLGTKEDECIISSDAELDAKLELFRSISDSCVQLQRILDSYQERLCVLAQEENALGKFLREASKTSDASGKHMLSTGKAISYCGQQRLSVRAPLLRMYHEVETFRGRAVSDMRETVAAMEKARTEYRAALSWMKSASAQLDPDTGRGLDNFRKAQRQVRESKKLFDKLTLDVLQKIDLLAAARCNMFSHVLVNYQSSFLNFSAKVAQTLLATADTMNTAPHYEFSILKELSQNLNDDEIQQEKTISQDKDQMLFFQDEYKDEEPKDNKKIKEESDVKNESKNDVSSKMSIDLTASASENLIDTDVQHNENNADLSGISSDLVGLSLDYGNNMPTSFGSLMPSQLLQGPNPTMLGTPLISTLTCCDKDDNSKKLASPENESKITPKTTDKAAWFKLFAELDPLANPDSLLGSHKNQSHAA